MVGVASVIVWFGPAFTTGGELGVAGGETEAIDARRRERRRRRGRRRGRERDAGRTGDLAPGVRERCGRRRTAVVRGATGERDRLHGPRDRLRRTRVRRR